MNILSKFKQIKHFVFDIDGVFTNNTLIVHSDGNLLRTMNARDGYAVQLALKKGYTISLISGGKGDVLQKRFEGLGVKEIHLGIHNKLEILENLITKYTIIKEELLYMGDDMLDLVCLQNAGLACVPADACSEVLQIANYISPFKGGEMCVRDVIEKVLKLNNDWE
jgi:3-deoxy-D-manno-octulosonate 8-phosphate phosphatase (KDO 8-P phosphatase)